VAENTFKIKALLADT